MSTSEIDIFPSSSLRRSSLTQTSLGKDVAGDGVYLGAGVYRYSACGGRAASGKAGKGERSSPQGGRPTFEALLILPG